VINDILQDLWFQMASLNSMLMKGVNEGYKDAYMIETLLETRLGWYETFIILFPVKSTS